MHKLKYQIQIVLVEALFLLFDFNLISNILMLDKVLIVKCNLLIFQKNYESDQSGTILIYFLFLKVIRRMLALILFNNSHKNKDIDCLILIL